MTLTRYGKKECWLLTVLALPLSLLFLAGGIFVAKAGYAFAFLFFLSWIAGISFFRNPKREIPDDENLILSPADGTIRDIELISASDSGHLAGVFEGRDMLRIGIAISVFDVRLNRIPCKFSVKLRERKEAEGGGKESVILAGTAHAGGKDFPMGIKQISWMGSGNIICEPVPGDDLECGFSYGIIKFGSRLELYLPAKSDLIEIKIGVGDKVQAGLTPIVEFSNK